MRLLDPPPSLDRPEFTFTIEDEGDPHEYEYTVYMRQSIPVGWTEEDWDTDGEVASVVGQITSPGSVTVTWDGSQEPGGDPDTMPAGVYSFDIFAREYDDVASEERELLDETGFKAPYATWVSELDSWIAVDEEGNAELRVKYMFTDDYDRGAVGDAHVTVLGPDLDELAVVDVPTETGVLHGGQDDDGDGEADGIVVYGLLPAGVGGAYQVVAWMGEVCAAPGRDSNPRRGLPGDDDGEVGGNYEIAQVFWCKDDSYKKPAVWHERIWRNGEDLYPRLELWAPDRRSAPDTVEVHIEGGVTDTSGFNMLLKWWYSWVEGGTGRTRHAYRAFAGQDPSIGPATDQANRVIGVCCDESDTTENTTHDNHDASDSNAITWGTTRGCGRSYADEHATPDPILLANLEYLQCAGIEKLELSSCDDSSLTDSIAAKNQADLLYFSGHGSSTTGKIWRGPCLPVPGVNSAGVGPGNWSDDLDVFVIAACSVLNIPDHTGHGTDNVGMAWANDCIAGRGAGPLDALCGYHDSAPADAGAGGLTAAIAGEFSSRFNGSNAPIAWQEANNAMESGTWWCAMDADYYYWHYKNILGLWGNGKKAY